MIEFVQTKLTEFASFIAHGFRDAMLEAAFTAFLTTAFIFMGAAISGRRLASVRVGGINLEFASKQTSDAYESREQNSPPKAILKKKLQQLVGTWNVLWVDDHPDWIRHEMNALAAVGFSFRVARTNSEAISHLNSEFFHLVISDIARDTDESGLDLPQILKQNSISTPMIFYVSNVTAPTTKDGVPVVNTPKELFQKIHEALR